MRLGARCSNAYSFSLALSEAHLCACSVLSKATIWFLLPGELHSWLNGEDSYVNKYVRVGLRAIKDLVKVQMREQGSRFGGVSKNFKEVTMELGLER